MSWGGGPKPGERETIGDKVRVGVHEAGEDGAAADVNRTFRGVAACSDDFGDTTVLDRDRGVLEHQVRCGIDDTSVPEAEAGHVDTLPGTSCQVKREYLINNDR